MMGLFDGQFGPQQQQGGNVYAGSQGQAQPRPNWAGGMQDFVKNMHQGMPVQPQGGTGVFGASPGNGLPPPPFALGNEQMPGNGMGPPPMQLDGPGGYGAPPVGGSNNVGNWTQPPMLGGGPQPGGGLGQGATNLTPLQGPMQPGGPQMQPGGPGGPPQGPQIGGPGNVGFMQPPPSGIGAGGGFARGMQPFMGQAGNGLRM